MKKNVGIVLILMMVMASLVCFSGFSSALSSAQVNYLGLISEQLAEGSNEKEGKVNLNVYVFINDASSQGEIVKISNTKLLSQKGEDYTNLVEGLFKGGIAEGEKFNEIHTVNLPVGTYDFSAVISLNGQIESKSTTVFVYPVRTIKGTISLPNDGKAPLGGIKLIVSALDDDKEYIIEEGKNSVDYCLSVTQRGKSRVECKLVTDTDTYYNQSFYSSTTSTPFEALSENIDIKSGDLSGIDITLIKNRKVTGTIVMPPDIVLKADSRVTITAAAQSDPHFVFDADPMPDLYFTNKTEVVIKKGSAKADFQLNLPEYAPGYFINYSNVDYVSGISPSSARYEKRTPLTGETSVTVTMDKGYIISGRISLPDGIDANEDGTNVTVSAIYLTSHITIGGPMLFENYIKNTVVIPKGQSFAEYEVTVFPQYDQYFMMYSVEGSQNLRKGYYSTKGTLAQLDKAVGSLNVTSDISDIDMDILGGVKVAGWLVCPDGKGAPVDISGHVDLILSDNSRNKYDFILPSGQNSVPFEFYVPKESEDIVLSYELDKYSEIYSTQAFYNHSGSVTYNSKAYKINVSDKPVEDISFYIQKKNKISGVLSFPDDMEAVDETLHFTIRAKNTGVDESIIYSHIDTACAVPGGKRSGTFEILVPEDFAESEISYWLDYSGDGLVVKGYLGENGCVLESKDAKIVHPGTADSANLTIVPIKGQRIWGKLILPEEKNYSSNIEAQIEYRFVDEDGPNSSGLSKYIRFSKETGKAEFFINIPPRYIGKEFTLCVNLLNVPGREIYYVADGFVTENFQDAKLFTYDGKDIKDMVIPIETVSPSYMCGDLSGDLKVNSIDFYLLRGYLLGIDSGIYKIKTANSDLNLDGKINSIDFSILRSYLLGKIVDIPVVK